MNIRIPTCASTNYSATDRSPAWLLLHRIGEPTDIRENLRDRHGNTYVLAKRLPYSDMSGWHLFLYRLGQPGRSR